MHHTDIESAIDDVARRMTTASTRAGWRAAAMTQIASSPRRHARWRLVPVWSAAVAVIALAAVLRIDHIHVARTDQRDQGDRTPPSSVSGAPRVGEPVTTSARALAGAVQPGREVPAPRTVPVAPVVRVQDGAIAMPANVGVPALPALALPDPAAAAPIQPEPLVIPQLAVQPMKELTPLTIPALGDIDRRP